MSWGCLGLSAGVLSLGSALHAATEDADNTCPPEISGIEGPRIKVQDTTTRVMVAQVHLQIGDMVFEEGFLRGTYTIEVPMRSSKNEQGSMWFELDQSLSDILHNGGVIKGEGRSIKRPEDQRLITCRIVPASASPRQGEIELDIDIGGRVLEFQTSYQVVGELAEATEAEAALAARD